jgi:hypothetical protein
LVTWDHTDCDHDDGDCAPRATFTCQADPDSLCLNGCQECEDVWWLCRGGEQCERERTEQQENLDEGDDPLPEHPAERHCIRGHLITSNGGECYAILNLHLGGNGPTSYADAMELYEGGNGDPMTWRMPIIDGPIVVINNGEDGCGWEYPEAAS